MDSIEFRSMNSTLQTTGSAQFVDPAAAPLNTNGEQNNGCGCEENGNNGGNGHIYYRECEETKTNALEDMDLENTGRVMDVTMTIRNVCPYRRVAVGYLVTEVDEDNNEHSRGFKAFTIDPHYYPRSRDIEVETMRFILPDDVRVDGGKNRGGSTRHFIVRANAHYADSNVSMT